MNQPEPQDNVYKAFATAPHTLKNMMDNYNKQSYFEIDLAINETKWLIGAYSNWKRDNHYTAEQIVTAENAWRAISADLYKWFRIELPAEF